jgi:hypothetical protein
MFVTIKAVYFPKQHAMTCLDCNGDILYSCETEIEYLCTRASTEPVEISEKIV